MSDVLNIRAKEMASLRDANRRLRRRISDMEATATGNDKMILAMHRLALLLIAREGDAESDGWRVRAGEILRRGFGSAACIVLLADDMTAPARARASKLPAGGASSSSSLSARARKAPLYYHLPLRRGRKTLGAAEFAMRRTDDLREGDDALCRRLAELLAAAL